MFPGLPNDQTRSDAFLKGEEFVRDPVPLQPRRAEIRQLPAGKADGPGLMAEPVEDAGDVDPLAADLKVHLLRAVRLAPLKGVEIECPLCEQVSRKRDDVHGVSKSCAFTRQTWPKQTDRA